MVKKWFDPEPVAAEEETSILLVPDREGEHSVEAAQAIDPVPPVCREDDLGVGPCDEPIPFPFKVSPQFEEVVNLSIINDHLPAIGGTHRLMTAGRGVQDGQSPVGKDHAAIVRKPDAIVVRPA